MNQYSEILIIKNIKNSLQDKDRFWLNLFSLLYVAFLPFNHFGFNASILGIVIKPTKLSLLGVLICTILACRRHQLHFLKSGIFYGLIFLQITANFLSMIYSIDIVTTFTISLRIFNYGLMVILLTNVFCDRRLLKAALSVMGSAAILISMHSFVIYIMNGGVFITHLQHSIVGNTLTHYLAYCLILFGSGLIYLYMEEDNKVMRNILCIFVFVWTFVSMLPATKISQIVTGVFLLLIVIFERQHKKRSLIPLAAFICSMMIIFNIVSIRNSFTLLHYKIAKAMNVNLDLQKEVYQPTVETRSFIAKEDRETDFFKQMAEGIIKKLKLSSRKKMIEAPTINEQSTSLKEYDSTQERKRRTFLHWLFGKQTYTSVKELLLDEYSDINAVKKRWHKAAVIDSIDLRTRGIITGWYMGLSAPLTGIGAGLTEEYFDQFSEYVREKLMASDLLNRYQIVSLIISDRIWTVDMGASIFNIFVNAWAETGVLGFVSITGLFIYIIFHGLLSLKKKDETRYFLAVFMALTLYHMAEYFWIHPWLWTIMSFTIAASKMEPYNATNCQIEQKG